MKRFDMAFSMGFSCGGTMALRRVGMQFASYPLDWIGSPGIVPSAQMIADDFAHWFDREELQLVAVRGGSFQNNVYQNRLTRFGFPHDFPRFYRFDEIYAKTAAKYERRIERFRNELSAAQTALVVYIERPINGRASDADLGKALDILAKKYPKTRFELVYFFLRDGLAGFEETRVSDAIAAVACDYKQLDHGEISHAIVADVPARYLKDRFEVEDRRTAEEKARYEADKKAGRRKHFGGRLNELKYRLYRRLERELQEKGLVPRDFPLWFD